MHGVVFGVTSGLLRCLTARHASVTASSQAATPLGEPLCHYWITVAQTKYTGTDDGAEAFVAIAMTGLAAE